MCVQDFYNKKKKRKGAFRFFVSNTHLAKAHACMHAGVCVLNNKIHTNPPEYDQQSKAAGSKPIAGMPGQRRSPAQQF